MATNTRPVTPHPALAQAVRNLARAPEFRVLYRIVQAEASQGPEAAQQSVNEIVSEVKEVLSEYAQSTTRKEPA